MVAVFVGMAFDSCYANEFADCDVSNAPAIPDRIVAQHGNSTPEISESSFAFKAIRYFPFHANFGEG